MQRRLIANYNIKYWQKPIKRSLHLSKLNLLVYITSAVVAEIHEALRINNNLKIAQGKDFPTMYQKNSQL